MRSAATPTRWCAGVLLGLYTLLIARLTLAPASSETGAVDLLNRIAATLSGDRLDATQAEALGNVALFVPAGFLLAIVLGRAWASVLLCALGSAAIELSQRLFLPSRVPSLADVEHNALGGLIGAVLALPLAYWVRTRRG
jgi:glycopeptide antibiotics resistance protein